MISCFFLGKIILFSTYFSILLNKYLLTCSYMPGPVLELGTQTNEVSSLHINHSVLGKLGSSSSED